MIQRPHAEAAGQRLRAIGCCAALLSGSAVLATEHSSDTDNPLGQDVAIPSPKSSTPVHGLAGTEWRLVQFQSMDDEVGTARPDDPGRYTMRLDGDGGVAMRLNCNRAQGTWSAQAGSDGNSGAFTFGDFKATDVRCQTPGMDRHIATLAGYIRSYLLKDGRLHLSLMADGGIYTWAPVGDDAAAGDVPATPEEGGPRNWEVSTISGRLNLRAGPSTSAGIVATYAPATVLDNLGCRRAEGRIWCDVQELGGGPRGYVAEEFLRPAVSPDGTAATGLDDSASRAADGKFDASGKIPCALASGQPMMPCEFGVARSGGGYATVVVKGGGGLSRVIFFRMGRPVGTDASEADGDIRFRASRESDLHKIQVGRERYEIPDAVIVGG